MSALAKLGLQGLGKESFENPLDENAEGYLATGESESETASAAILEATKESADIDEDIETLDNTMEATDDIDDQIEVAEIAIEQNQYTSTLGMIQKIGLKNALTKVASRRVASDLVDNKLMPAHEAFENGNGPTLALEGLKETAGELWTSIKAQFKQIMDRIVNFLKGIFDAATKLERRAEKLKSVTKNAKAGKVKPAGAKTLMVGNKLGTDALDGLNIVLDALNRATDESEVASSLSALTTEAKTAKVISFTGGTVPSELKSAAPEGTDVTCSKEASGGVVFATVTGKGEDAIGNTFNEVHRTAKKEAPGESDALSSSECGSGLNTVIQIAKAVGRGKAVAAKFDSFVKQFNSNIDKASKNDDKAKEQATRKHLQAGLKFAGKVTKFRKDVVTLALGAGNAMCNYVEASCGKSTGEKEADKKLPA